MPGLGSRVLVPELMDIEPVDAAEFAACLRDLAVVNALTNAYAPTRAFVREAARRLRTARPLRIVDAGGGYGDALRHLERWARRRRLALDLVSIDLNPHARRAGERATPSRSRIRFVTADLFDWKPDGPVDCVISSLFAHHLDDDGVVRFLRMMEETARIGWFVNDLHRHAVPLHVFRAWSRLAGWHRFVRHDGPVSIGRAFRRRDWEVLLARAAIPAGAARIGWRVPFRLCVSRFR